MNEVAIIFSLVAANKRIGKTAEQILEKLKNVRTTIFLCINKIDSVKKEELVQVIDTYKNRGDFAEVIPISAYEGTNVESLMACVEKYLPEGPLFFPEDMITDQPERVLIAELIREKALHLLDKEIPHGIAVEIDSIAKREDGEILDVEATIVCERDSHKRIIIGKQGTMIKQIGTNARRDIERLLGSKIFLNLWVKVKKNWRDSDFLVKNYGFNPRDLE